MLATVARSFVPPSGHLAQQILTDDSGLAYAKFQYPPVGFATDRLPGVALAEAPPARSAAPKKRWTPDEVAQLERDYPSCASVAALSPRYGRSAKALYAKASGLGLRRKLAPVTLAPTFIIPKKGKRCDWTNDAVSVIAALWMRGFTHKAISALSGQAHVTPGAVRSIATNRGFADRAGYALHRTWNASAADLRGIDEMMVAKTCRKTGKLFFVPKRDISKIIYSKAYKKSAAYRDFVDHAFAAHV